jgi:transcriptional antiterminator RfaH
MNWFIIYTKPGNEELVCSQLLKAGLDVLLPKIAVKKYNDGRIIEKIEPMFPNYIFCELDIMKHYRFINYTRGVKYILYKNNPAELPYFVILELKKRMDANGIIKIENKKFSPQERVVITGGPFKDFYGLFEKELNRKDRVLILLEVLNAKIEIDACMLEKL